jgi:hypothetical protein
MPPSATTSPSQSPPASPAAAAAASPSPAVPLPFTSPGPDDVAWHHDMAEGVLQLQEMYTPTNTQTAYVSKQNEFFKFCEHITRNDRDKTGMYILNEKKVFAFMWYLSFREKKPRGGNKKRRQEGATFDSELYEQMRTEAQQSVGGAIFPKKPIGEPSFLLYKAALRKLYRMQVSRKILALNWDQIWCLNCSNLQKVVSVRAPMVKKATYQEKVTGEFAPYVVVERYNDIEDFLWNDSDCAYQRSVNTMLRHRYCLLHLTSGILRCESLYRAELSDFIGLHPPKHDGDVHKMFLMINQIAHGKTNHGRILYGRATRHKEVELCCVGALSFYLSYRFFCTHEFQDFTVEDWMDNSKWFDVKLLVDTRAFDRKVAMKSDSYGEHIKEVLQKLSITCNKLLHLGRNLGTKILDLLEEESEGIKRMGQWNPSIFDASYSSKLPMGPIRKLAGFASDSKCYFNTRTIIDPPEELLVETPIGGWAYNAFNNLLNETQGMSHHTALSVLKFLTELNKVFLQDAAAMIIKFPERVDHAMYQHIPVLQTDAFKAYTETMRDAIETESNPHDERLDIAIPGIRQMHAETDRKINTTLAELRDLKEGQNDLKEGQSLLEQHILQQQEHIDAKQKEMASQLVKMAARIVGKSPTTMPLSPSSPLSPSPTENNDGHEILVTQSPNIPTAQTTTNPSAYNMKARHEFLQDMWDEWYGLNSYESKCGDIPGGIDARNKLFGRKWRKHYSSAQYSRTHRIIKMISTMIENLEEPTPSAAEEVIKELQVVYVEVGCSVSAMVERCQDKGWIPKQKPRGKKRTAEDDTSNGLSC